MARPRKVPPEPTEQETVTNGIKGTQLYLGDGRVLAFGESADVSEELATFLRDRGQAK